MYGDGKYKFHQKIGWHMRIENVINITTRIRIPDFPKQALTLKIKIGKDVRMQVTSVISQAGFLNARHGGFDHRRISLSWADSCLLFI